MALNGGPVRLDNSLSHLPGSDDLMGSGGQSILSPMYNQNAPYYPYSQLDIAMLKDIGWNTKPILV